MKGIPFSVGRFLQDAIARVRRIYLIRGIAAVGIVWVLGIVAVMAVDSSLVIFDDRIRWAMTAGVWLFALVAAMLAIVRPLRRRLDFRRMAAILDRRHPEQEERLSTLVELSESDAAKAGFSASLFTLVGNLAEGDVAKLDLKREFPAFGAWCRFGVFALTAAALALGALVSPNLIGRLFIRAVAPWSDIGNLFSDEISVNPGDITILSGSVIHIEVAPNHSTAEPLNRLTSEPLNYSIRISRKRPYGWSEETSEMMSGGVYETTADLNEREWRYRVTAGHAVTRYYYVRVSQMPKYDLFTATVDYPAYTHLQPLVLSNAEVGAITAIQGSRVKFDVRVSDPGTLADFRIGKEPLLEHTMVSNRTVSWSLDLVNSDGFRAEKGRYPLKSFIDQPPTVVIEKPTGTLRLPPHAKIPVEITATDDVAIEEAYFRVSIDNEPWTRHYPTKIDLSSQTLNSQLSTPNSSFVRTTADVDLSVYDLVFAKNVRFDVVVSDGCPPEFGGPHSATSTPFTVQFNADVSNYAMQELKREVDDARRDIDEARKRLNDAQNLARQVRDELRRGDKVSESTEQKGEKLAHELDEAAKRIEELRNDFLADERFTPLTRPLDRTLEEDVRPALTQVENAQFLDRGERADAVDAAIPEMAKAVQELDELKKRLDERTAKVDAFEKAKDLAARQEALTKAAKDIIAERPTDTAKIEAWKRLEDAAMRKAEELSRIAPSPDLEEAKRKMESAVRKMEELKRELDLESRKNLDEKQKAAQREQQRKADETRVLGELKSAANSQAQAAQALKRRDHKATQRAQKDAEDRLERGGATEAVKALQQLAGESERAAQRDPDSKERAGAAEAAQKAATDALKRELDIREGMRKGEKTQDDLDALDRELMEGLVRNAAARTRAAQAAADAALKAARDAVGSEKPETLDRLAAAALQAKREALAAELSESKLRNDTRRADALRTAADRLDAVEATCAEASAAEAKILSQQQDALQALERNDRGRAMNLQREVAQAQARAAETVADGEDAKEARASANAAQTAAGESTAAAHANWNNDTKAEAVKAQKEAMERERMAQDEARIMRSMDRLTAAERGVMPEGDASEGEAQDDQGRGKATEAAQAATDAMDREVNAQATSLGMSRRTSEAGAAKGRGKEQSSSGGGDLSDEVSDLAKELKRNDGPGFMQSLFSRFGWFKLRGLSGDGIGTQDLKDVPREYRDLVRRYFLKLSEENP